MLQQTRVATVIPYYQRFLERFPDVEALAAAPEQDLLECWSGLGYYRRARQMQAAARAVVTEYGAKFPDTYQQLRSLPGIGAYTAAAIASIAFGRPHAVVDGNVLRVLTRLFDDGRDVTKSATRRALEAQAQQLVESAAPRQYGSFNQALMELGATLCTPRGPQCLVCPLASFCRARAHGTEHKRPVKPPKRPSQPLEMAVVLVRRGRSLLARQRPDSEPLMPAFWELPQTEGPSLGPDCFRHLGIERGPRIGEFRHGITFRSYRGSVYRGELHNALPSGYRWISRSRLESLPLTTIARKALAAAAESPSRRPLAPHQAKLFSNS